MLYFAYGSNLSITRMKRRCPAARPVRRFVLKDWRLVFRGVADIIPAEGYKVGGALWFITPECERALDIYEGWRPDGGGMYRKEYGQLREPVWGEHRVMFYVMNSEGIHPPSQDYLDIIREGYRDFRLSKRRLHDALAHSHDEKAPSYLERQRYARTGRPRLAPRPVLV